MRILIINSEYPPIGAGAGNASANIARTFAEMGQEVTVLTARYGDLPRDEINAGVRIIRVPAIRKSRERSGALEQSSFILGCNFTALSFTKQWKPDITLAFFGVPSGVVALILKIFYKVPYIVSLRGGDVPGFRSYDFALFHKIIRPLLKKVWKKSEDVVANSNGLRALAHEFSNLFISTSSPFKTAYLNNSYKMQSNCTPTPAILANFLLTVSILPPFRHSSQ